jgi:hypothetical protein
MKTAYFPVARMEEKRIDWLSRWLGPLLLVVPTAPGEELERMAAQGRVTLVHPHPGLDDAVFSAIEEMTAWASSRNIEDLRYFRSIGRSPFSMAESSYRIGDEIRSAVSGKASRSDDAVLRAKVVLELARRLERQREELNAEWRGLAESEKTLERWLSEGDGEAAPGGRASLEALPDPFGFTDRDRLQAWARLASSSDAFGSGGLFLWLTDAHEVFEDVVEACGAGGVEPVRLVLTPDAEPEDPRQDVERRLLSGESEAGTPAPADERHRLLAVPTPFPTPGALLDRLAGTDAARSEPVGARSVWLGCFGG